MVMQIGLDGAVENAIRLFITVKPIIVRDGRKLRFMYHERCFSGSLDPCSQSDSSYHEQKWANVRSIQDKASSVKG